MEANEFIATLKATDVAKDFIDLVKAIEEYKIIISKLPQNDRGIFSLNVLCTLCRNLDKAPSWRSIIDHQALLTLTIECIRGTRALEKDNRVKCLACIYHIHKYVVRLNKHLPPELIFKVSFMPFELESKHLLQEYYKTYGNIVTDRLAYIERLKAKVNIVKLLPKLMEDIAKVIDLYDTVEFCSNMLVYLVKKLYLLYSAHPNDLNQVFVQIFTKLSTKEDLKLFKNLTEKESLDIYVKLNDCIYVIVENSLKINCKGKLDDIIHACIMLQGHNIELKHCFQTFYINCFCCLFKDTNASYKETILNGMVHTFEVGDKLGYLKTMQATYPYLGQLLRLYIEHNITNCSKQPWANHFNVRMQESCLKLIHFIIRKSRTCNQLTKCENCQVKSGLHDSLRLSFLVKHFITTSISQKIVITEFFPAFEAVVMEQHAILAELNKLGCENCDKCFRKLQTDVHNTAIVLNKAQYYEFSITLFNIYINYELKCEEVDDKNVSRALYNKSICELDYKLYERALINAFLSLIFCQDLNTDKYMSLVIDIKSKELKSKSVEEDEEMATENIQMLSVLDACKMALEQQLYGDLKPFISRIQFSAILKHEFAAYCRMWPAMAPLSALWRSFLDLYSGHHDCWITGESKDVMEQILHEVALETPSVARTIHNEHFTKLVDRLLDSLSNTYQKVSPEGTLVHAALLLLRVEFDLAEASVKHNWKSDDPCEILDPDQVVATRTIPQEHPATARAAPAITLLTGLLPDIPRVDKQHLSWALHALQVFVPLLLTLARDVEALQLAYICCRIADTVQDDSSYIRNAGTLVYHSARPSPPLDAVIARSARKWRALADRGAEPALVYLSDMAMYNIRVGAAGVASRLIRQAQARILAAYEKQPDADLQLAVGRALEAQAALCGVGGGAGAPTALTALNNTQRHYLCVSTAGSKWAGRRLYALSVRAHNSLASCRACSLPRALLLWRRARCSAAVVLHTETAAKRTALYAEITDPSSFEDAQIKIDSHLKHMLGFQPSNEIQPHHATNADKQALFTLEQHIETMRDCMYFQGKNSSPSISYISAFKIPDFFRHDSECLCYACQIPYCLILACKTSGLEAAMYSRANETQIAKNYFEGAMKMFNIAHRKMKRISEKYKDVYEDFIVSSVMKAYSTELKTTQIEALIELSFLELKHQNYNLADDNIVRIHEIIEEIENVDGYLNNAVMNLMTASARLKKTTKKSAETGLEAELDSLRLSPVKEPTNIEQQKTPESKPARPPQPATRVIVKDEELPQKRKVIKFNLDESSDEKDFEKRTRSTRRVKKSEFKIPNAITSKPTFEIATPRPTRSVLKMDALHAGETATPSELRPRSVPSILINQPSEEMATPKPRDESNNEFFTPEATPVQFFTPMTSVKTYTNKSLRHNIVKKLEQEFSTPTTVEKSGKENATTSNILKVPEKAKKQSGVNRKTTLRRATSPGKLGKDKKETVTRTRRLRQPVKLSLDEGDNT